LNQKSFGLEQSIGVNEANALLALTGFTKLPQNLIFGHCLTKVEPKVV
jgi:hypothetical protein